MDLLQFSVLHGEGPHCSHVPKSLIGDACSFRYLRAEPDKNARDILTETRILVVRRSIKLARCVVIKPVPGLLEKACGGRSR